MSSYIKGANAEREFKQILENRGYWVYKPNRSRYHDNDLWNTWDMAGINQKELVLVQVKCNQVRDTRKQLREFPSIPNIRKILAIRIDRKGWIEEEIE